MPCDLLGALFILAHCKRHLSKGLDHGGFAWRVAIKTHQQKVIWSPVVVPRFLE